VPSLKNQPEDRRTDHSARPDDPHGNAHPDHHHSIYATEAIGLLLIATLLLAITLIRYWHYIHWSLR
jgi:hypothetical protein